MRHLFALLKHAKAYKKEYILGPIFKVLEAIFELIIPLVIADMIDRGVNAGDSAYIYRSGALLAALSLIGFSSTLVCQFMASRAAQGTGTVLRGKLFSHIILHSAAKASAQIEMKADGWRRNLIFILYTIYEERQTTTHVEVSRRGTSC